MGREKIESLEHSPLRGRYFSGDAKREVTMKRVLIAVATVGVLAPAAWVTEANAQYGAPAPAYSAPAYGPSQTYAPSRKYARRAYRRSARAPRPSGGNLVYTP